MARRGADLVVDALAAAGVRNLFSLSGNQILSVYDATIGRGISIIHTRHEAAAVHMADAWGRLTEQPGVALVTAGPGHMNALSALYGALMAESPVVLLSGHAPLGQLGRGAFQEMDQVAAAAPVTKAAWLARDADRLGDDVARALELARSGRPGPVHVSLPTDLLDAAVGDGAGPGDGARATTDAARGGNGARASGRDRPVPATAARPIDEPALRETLRLLAGAKRPLILLGPAMARPLRRAAVDRLSATTGIPALPIESPRGLNDPWLHLAAPRLAEADVVVLLGRRADYAVRFAEPPAFSPACRFVQIDVEATAPRAAERAALAVAGDPVAITDRLDAAARKRPWPHHAWGQELARARSAAPSEWEALRRGSRAPLHPLRVCAALEPHLARGAVLVCDGGEFGQWIQAGAEAEIRLINGLSGSIGSAIPMGCAARLAHPDRAVIVAVGDGTFGFHALELDTALRYGLPIVVVVGNDARWNAEHQLQRERYGAARTIGCELRPTRYDLVAAGLGGHGELVEHADDLEPALARAMKSDRPACVNVAIDGAAAPTYRAGAGAH